MGKSRRKRAARSAARNAMRSTPAWLFVNKLHFGPPVAAPSLHEWGPLVVPAGTFFMMGDNRDDSVDSRDYGPAPSRPFGGGASERGSTDLEETGSWSRPIGGSSGMTLDS